MSRALTIQYGCDAVACGLVVWIPVLNNDPANLFRTPLPGDWTGTAEVQFCPKHAHLVHAHRAREATR